MATTSFNAVVDSTVTVNGTVYTLTIPTLPDNVHLTLNETVLASGQTVTLTENMTLGVTVDTPDPVSLAVTYTNANTVTLDGKALTAPDVIDLEGGNHEIDFVGATAIPAVTVNGEGVTEFSVNGVGYESTNLPYTFTPTGGITNQVFMKGQAGEAPVITITGTDIETMTINNVDTPLPYSGQVTGAMHVGVAGKIYNVDLTSVGGVKIEQDGNVISSGTTGLHKVISVDRDIYLKTDGTHTLSITGQDIKSISVNGVEFPISELPVSIKNNAMTASVVVSGYEPSEVHVVGQYMETVTVDGVTVPLGENGACDFELTTVEQNHFVNIVGAQPRQYGITWNDNDATTIKMDGKAQTSGTTSLINKDVYVAATPDPIPIHIESSPTATVQVDGKRYNSNDFTVNVTEMTEIDVTTDGCSVTIDYGDGSYSLYLPQQMVTFTAPHRDGWVFDSWSSNDVGIENAKSVRTAIDLTGKNTAHLVAHYQRCYTLNKPNTWN